jgi:hypothetical protein
MGTTKASTERQRGATDGTPALDKPSITSMNSAVRGRSWAGMKSQGARPQVALYSNSSRSLRCAQNPLRSMASGSRK